MNTNCIKVHTSGIYLISVLVALSCWCKLYAEDSALFVVAGYSSHPSASPGRLKGFIDRHGNQVISFRYGDARPFKEGLAAVSMRGKWGFIDKTGVFVVKPEYCWAGDFYEGFALVAISTKEKGKSTIKLGFIDKRGRIVIKPRFDFDRSCCNDTYFKDGFACIGRNNKWGCIDRKGRFSIRLRYGSPFCFSEGLAAVKRSKHWGYINKDGEAVLPFDYEYARKFSGGLGWVKKDGKWGALDSAGNFVIEPRYEDALPFSEGLAWVKEGGKWGCIDMKGKHVIIAQFEDVWRPRFATFSEGLASVSVNKKWGYIDKEGSMIIDPQFSQASPFTNDLALVVTDSENPLTAYIDRTGAMVWKESQPVKRAPATRIAVGGGAGGFFGGRYRKRGRISKSPGNFNEAVESGLEWLKRHQNPEGLWECKGFNSQCSGDCCFGIGHEVNDVGVTAFALLAFLGAGNTIGIGPYQENVERAVKYLCDVQDSNDGCLAPKGSENSMYSHVVGTLALVEAYGLSRRPELKEHAQSALDYISATKNSGKTWGYNAEETDFIVQDNVSVTGWIVMCLVSAMDFELDYDKNELNEYLNFISEMTDPKTGRTSYRTKGSRDLGEEGNESIKNTETMTAAAMFSRIFGACAIREMKKHRKSVEAGAEMLRKALPKWDGEKGSIDYHYWYYGTYAMFQMDGKYWKAWKTAMERAIVDSQCKEGCERGSWDPRRDPWGKNGGRVYSTAILTLCLEVYSRYDSFLAYH